MHELMVEHLRKHGLGSKRSTKVVTYDHKEGRERFNWQDRKRHDLKGHPRGCASCDLEPVCEGVWKGYLEIWGDREFRPVRLADTALAPRPTETNRGADGSAP